MTFSSNNFKDIVPDATKRVEDNEPVAGPSSGPPPTFEESTKDDVLLNFGDDPDTYVPPGGEGPPPSFAPYEAEYFIARDGSIVSHDPHLNQDGEALYRFLLSQASTTPSYLLHCKGTHIEHRTRFVTESESSDPGSSQSQAKTEAYDEEVTDFDFCIDATPSIIPNSVVQWTVGDDVPTYRGKMVKEVGVPGQTRRSQRMEIKAAKRWEVERRVIGLPPWVAPWSTERESDGAAGQSALLRQRGQVREVLKSSWTLRQWADDYCSSPKHLKEFTYEKVVYGWNTDLLTAAIRSAILSLKPHYSSPSLSNSTLTIAFLTTNSRISIRPSTTLSRTLSNPWLKLLLIVTLIYPFIYLFQRFHKSGGGKWEVGGAAYAVKRWAPGSVLVAGEEQEPGRGSRMEGTREGVWFEIWERTVRRAVAEGRIDRIPMQVPDSEVAGPSSSTEFIGRLV